MGAAHERSSPDRPERAQHDPPAAQSSPATGPVIAAPGMMLDGIGNRALLALLRSGRLQRKARISEPGDAAEHEADRVARQVTSIPDHRLAAVAPPALRRLPAPSPNPAPGDMPGGIHEVLRSPGQRLDPPVRDFFEARFGYDLSEVRVHDDAQAAASAQAIAADAYTTGAHIAFAAGRHRPDTAQGRELLAHELAHVVQQNAGDTAVIRRAPAPAEYQGDAPRTTAPAAPVSNPTPRVSDDDWIGALEILRLQSPGDFLKLLIANEGIFYPILAHYGFQGSWVKKEDYFADFDQAVQKWGKASIYLQRYAAAARAAPQPQPKPKSREERQYEDAQYMVIDMNRHGHTRSEVNDALESAGLMEDLENHGFERAGRWSFRNSEAYEQSAIRALNDFIGRYQVAHNINVPTTASVPTPDPAEYYRAWLEGLEYVTSSFVAAEFAEFASKFTDDPRKITAAAGLGAAFEGAAGAYFTAVGNRGSYAPDVENKPLSVQVQELRYGGAQPIKPAIDPARVADPPPRDPLPKPDPVKTPDPLPPASDTPVKAPTKPPVEVKPPVTTDPVPVSTTRTATDPLAGAVQRPVDVTERSAFPPAPDPAAARRQLELDIQQARERFERLQKRAKEAEDAYARSLRPTVGAKERRGEQPTQQETDLLAAKDSLAKAREDARSKLKQLEQKRAAEQPNKGAQRVGQEGLAQEPIYVEELRARGLKARKTDPGSPVIDAAIEGTPEVHSVKTIEPGPSTDAAVQQAEDGSIRVLADRVGARIGEALMDRGSDKWSKLRNQWNDTKRETYADHFGYELPKDPDEVTFVVDVRVVSAVEISESRRNEVLVAVVAWLHKNRRLPPPGRFLWQITYVKK